MTMEPSGGPSITVVAPGSSGDPFSVNNPANQEPGQTPSVVVGAPASQPVQPAPTTPDPGVVLQTTNPGTEPVTTPVPGTGQTADDINRIVQERLSAAQSNWDKRITTLQAEIDKANKATADAETRAVAQQREFQLQGLRPEQQAQLREQWSIEDERAALKAERSQVIDYHKTVEGLRLLTTYAPFGVTEDQLLGIKDLDEMEKFCLRAKADFFEGGGKAPASAGSVPARQQPAGASAPIDIGGKTPVQEGPKVLTTAGVESMSANIKNMFA